MHEGHHGIFDDIEDMDDLFGVNEEHDHDHEHHHHEHNHNHEHHDHEHNEDSENHHKKKFGLFKKKRADK